MKKSMLLLPVIAFALQVAASDHEITANISMVTSLTTQPINFGVPFVTGATVGDVWGSAAKVDSTLQDAYINGQNVILTWGAKNSSQPLLVNINDGTSSFPFDFYKMNTINTAWDAEGTILVVGDGGSILYYGSDTGNDSAYVYINALVANGTLIPAASGAYSHTATLEAFSAN